MVDRKYLNSSTFTTPHIFTFPPVSLWLLLVTFIPLLSRAHLILLPTTHRSHCSTLPSHLSFSLIACDYAIPLSSYLASANSSTVSTGALLYQRRWSLLNWSLTDPVWKCHFWWFLVAGLPGAMECKPGISAQCVSLSFRRTSELHLCSALQAFTVEGQFLFGLI